MSTVEIDNIKPDPLGDIDEELYHKLLEKLANMNKTRRTRLSTVKENIKQIANSIQERQFATKL